MCTVLYCNIKLSFLLTINFTCLDLIRLTSNWVKRWPKSTGIFCHHKSLHSVFSQFCCRQILQQIYIRWCKHAKMVMTHVNSCCDQVGALKACWKCFLPHVKIVQWGGQSRDWFLITISSCKNGPVGWSIKRLVSNLRLVQTAPAEASLRMLRLQQRTAGGRMPAMAYVWSKLSLLLFMEASLMMLRLWWRTACGIMPAMALRVCNNSNNKI